MAIEWEAAAKKASAGTLIEAQARAVINSIMEHAGQQPVVFYRTRDWLEEWLTDKGRSKAKTTAEKYRAVVERFLDHLGRRADRSLAEVKAADIRSFRDLLHQEGRAGATVNQIITQVLSAPFSKAVRLGYLPLNPCAAVEPLKETRTEAKTFTLEQIKALLNAAPSQEWRTFILAGYLTGQRLRDIANLQWQQIDMQTGMIYLEQNKGDAGVAVPIHPDLRGALLALPGAGDTDTIVFPSIQQMSGSGRSGISESFKRIMVKAGIPLKKRLEAAGPAGRGRNELSFHSLRHSLNSVMANAGIAKEVREKLLGHRDSESNKTYTHLDFPAFQAAISVVPSVLKAET